MKNIIFVSIIALFVVFLAGCSGAKKWSLFVYPDGNPSGKNINAIDAYDSFEECKGGFEFSKQSFPNADFECGYKCRIQDAGLDLYICDETRDY